MNAEPSHVASEEAETSTSDQRAGGERFPVVAIGGSAGALDALRKLFKAMPTDAGVGFVVIIHLAPSRHSHLADILDSVTSMPVTQVEDGEPVRPNHVHVIGPNTYLAIEQGRFRVSASVKRPIIPMPIDYFMSSLAEDQKERAISIILTGADGDGTLGSKEIKAAGGLIMVQTPETAQTPSMPLSVIATGLADLVLPIEEMPAALMQYVRHVPTDGSEAEADAADEEKLNQILALARTRSGPDFRCYKKAMLMRRVRRRMGLRNCESLSDYYKHVHETPQELHALIGDLLIGVTEFFREPDGWSVFEQEIIPQLLEAKGPDTSLRIWVPGCSTGEEAYTIAMLLLERLDPDERTDQINIFATDIDRKALDIARAGSYPQTTANAVSAERLKRFFIPAGAGFQVTKQLREAVLFAQQNLVTDPPFSRLDLISCHNLLIYLDTELQKRVIELFHFALKPGGYLFLGKSESIGHEQSLFELVSKKWRIYRSIGATRQIPVGFPLLRERSVGGSTRPGQSQREVSYASVMHEQLLAMHAPAAVLVNHDYQTLYFFGGTEQYLAQPAGAPTGDLLAMTRSELRPKLRAALRKAMQEEQTVQASAQLSRADGLLKVDMTVVPLRAPPGAAGLLLVTFHNQEPAAQPSLEPAANDNEDNAAVRQLEEELDNTRQELQSTIEQLETANEELKVSNEEAMSMNEELQSTNEELETSKEELQSLNEELSTVNVQLEDKLKELEQANNDLTNLLSSTSIATLFLDRQFRIKGFTPALTRLIHVIASDINRPISHIAGPFAGAELTESAQSVLDDLAAHEREVSADPNHHYLRRILPYRTENERIEGVVVTFTDITELKRGAEQARRLAAVVRDSNDAILVCDFEGRILSWNRGAEEMYGYTEQEALRLNMAAMIPDSARARHDEWVDRARRSEPAQPTKTQRIAKDGKIVDILFTLSVLRDSAGMPTAIASTERDITHQLITEKELRTRAERLIEADRRKDEFLAMLAHELRNPLAPIRNAVEALGQPRLLDDKASLEVSRKVIERQVKHLSRLVDDLLDVSRITRGQVSLQQEKIELGSLVERAVELNREQIESRQHRLSISVPAEPIWLEGDATRITQVLGNLLNNAAKYTDPGGAISVSVSVENRQGVFRVRDTGMGIVADLLPHVFDLFVQGKRSLDRSQGGLGIGLRLVRQLVEMHGGTVAARSDGPGYGSEFEVRLPLDQQARAATISKRFDVPPPLPLIPAKGLRALVVDDNPDTVESMSALLGMHGHEVRTASDGELAVQVAKDFQPEAVLLDIGLPGIDGYEVARRLRDIPATHNALLLAVTGYGTPEDRRASQDAGFDYHLVKPVDPGSILGLLRAHAQRT